MLNDIENEFIEFMAQRQGKTIDYVTRVYLETKKNFQFHTPEFRALTVKVYDLNKLLHDEITEKELINTYKYHELMSAYRFLSYTFEEKKEAGVLKKIMTFTRLLATGNIKIIYTTSVKKVFLRKNQKQISGKKEPASFSGLAEYLTDTAERPITTIVDYGCGPAYISFEIAKLYKKRGLQIPKVVLVDIDCLMKDFVESRFKRHGFPVETISVNEENLYPTLPEHDLCIATEVMEHVKDPIKVFRNINSNLQQGGVLYGNYEDHTPHMLHVSPDLSMLRDELKKFSYKKLSRLTFVKK